MAARGPSLTRWCEPERRAAHHSPLRSGVRRCHTRRFSHQHVAMTLMRSANSRHRHATTCVSGATAAPRRRCRAILLRSGASAVERRQDCVALERCRRRLRSCCSAHLRQPEVPRLLVAHRHPSGPTHGQIGLSEPTTRSTPQLSPHAQYANQLCFPSSRDRTATPGAATGHPHSYRQLASRTGFEPVSPP